jgi:hypothetical protein
MLRGRTRAGRGRPDDVLRPALTMRRSRDRQKKTAQRKSCRVVPTVDKPVDIAVRLLRHCGA